MLINILINGSPSSPIKLQKGLRQGDPLSPFLFNIIVEVLHLIIEKSTSMQLWEGIEACPGGPRISHLQYADDILLFCPPKMAFLQNIKKALILFHLASGLKVNFHKSSLMGLNVTDVWIDCAAKNLYCKKGSIPFNYLGLPIGGNSSRLSFWDPIIERMENKLSVWRGKLMSIGGRLTLIKSSLSNLPLYFMSLFPIPQSIILRIIRIQRQFLWCKSSEVKTMAPINWNTVQLPRSLGGLSTGNLLHRNLALLFKWAWRLFAEPDSLWCRVIRCKYKYSWYLSPSDLEVPSHGGPWKKICGSLLNNPHAKNLTLKGPRKRVGNGLNTLFWLETWITDSPLKEKFPRLFSISSHQRASVNAMGLWDGHSWLWNFSWTRELRVRDTAEKVQLESLLNKVCISLESADEVIWAPSKTGSFSVKSFAEELAKMDQSTPHDPLIGKVWKGLVPPRIEFFAWLACHGKLNTRSKLAKLHIIPPSHDLCPLCNEKSESVNHLLLHCNYAWRVWCWWMKLWDVTWASPPSLKAHLQIWSIHGRDPFFKKVWWAVFFIIIWSIWKERNARIFQQVVCSIEKTCEMILLRLGWWIKGWGEPFPYSSDEIARNPHCLRNFLNLQKKSKAGSPALIAWIPPPCNHLKWNVDASFDPSLGRAAVGGVLRDDSGQFICLFSSPIPCMEINSAEVFAILRSIKISMSCERLKNRMIIIESDSKNAVQWCSKESGGPWNLGFPLNFIRNAQQSWLNISIIHKGRESNMVADTLAKQGLNRLDEFLAWC